MISIKRKIINYLLKEILLNGATTTIRINIDKGKSQELLELIEASYPETFDMIVINGFIKFSPRYIYTKLGIEVDEK